MAHSFGTASANVGGKPIALSFIKTSPNDVQPQKVNPAKTLANGSLDGINAGFFDMSNYAILSIAIVNHKPVVGTRFDYGGGWNNEKYERGTLVWDAKAREYTIQIVGSGADLSVSNQKSYWAQGGVSMSLGNDTGWYNIAKDQNLPTIDSDAWRSALVYNDGLNIWLVATNSPCTAKEFRTAIKNNIGSGTLVDGIFLDGGASTQIRYGQNGFTSTRAIPQIIALL